jgi:hypothetical protein
MELRDYQVTALSQVKSILLKHGVCYLAGEVRTGKTIIALHVASMPQFKRVLFVTKKLAISSIKSDIEKSKLKLNIEVINYEQLHKINYKPTLIIYDEAHNLGQFPKPAKKTVQAKINFKLIPTLFLSGTPSPESYSQLFHQFWVTGRGPWAQYETFYSWAKHFVNVRQKYVGSGRLINSYSETKPEVQHQFNEYKVSITQENAGFDGKVVEVIHHIEMPNICKEYINGIKKNKVHESLVVDSGSRRMSFIHQVCSGTVINNDGDRIYLSNFKIKFIKKTFSGKRIAIFYCFIAEGLMLEESFATTRDPVEFKNNKDLVFISQVVSGREGINLSIAEEIIFLNISHSALSYWQARARSQSIDGGNKRVHWLFSIDGIEEKIYETITQRKSNYTLSHFNKDYDQRQNPRKLSAG